MTDVQIQHIVTAIALNGFWTERCGPVAMRTELHDAFPKIEAAALASTIRQIDSLIHISAKIDGQWDHIVFDPEHFDFAVAGGSQEWIRVVQAHVDRYHPDPHKPIVGCFGINTQRKLPDNLN